MSLVNAGAKSQELTAKGQRLLAEDLCCLPPSGSIMTCMGFSETIFLFFLALLIFGPKRLPEIARQVGKVMNDLRRASYEFKSQIEAEISHLETDQKPLPPAQRPLGAIASLSAKSEPAAESSAAQALPVACPEPTTAGAGAQPSAAPETPQLKAPDA